MPDLNDYHAFQSTTGGGSGNGGGCSGGCLPCILAGIGLLWLSGWLLSGWLFG